MMTNDVQAIMNSEAHAYSVKVAMAVGVEQAVMLQTVGHWVKTHALKGINHHDGKYWFYKTAKELHDERYPYWSPKKISRLLAKLEDGGYIESSNFNRHKYDRTKWYTLTQKGMDILGLTISQICPKDDADMSDDISKSDEPIPDTYTNTKTNTKTNTNSNSCASHRRGTMSGSDDSYNEDFPSGELSSWKTHICLCRSLQDGGINVLQDRDDILVDGQKSLNEVCYALTGERKPYVDELYEYYCERGFRTDNGGDLSTLSVLEDVLTGWDANYAR